MAGSARSGRSRKPLAELSHEHQTDILIHVYDLVPPGKLSSILWAVGAGLLHTGVVVNDREYAFGGHDRKGVTGVYCTKPKLVPPGARFRLEIHHGTCTYTPREIETIINETSSQFDGYAYNILKNNCNHFTSHFCEKLTGKPAPAWLNRAASIGLALPCIVPRAWINPPDHETAEGELVDNQDDENDERAAMLTSERRGATRESDQEQDQEYRRTSVGGQKYPQRSSTPPARLVSITDSSGRNMPASERAPLPKRWSG